MEQMVPVSPTGGRVPPPGRGRWEVRGFTLIELLIVIAIIGMLAALVTAAVGKVKGQALVAKARTDVDVIGNGLKAYESDYNFFPGRNAEAREDVNSFPEVYEALCGDPPPDGKGGRNAPYVELKTENLVVYTDYEEELYELATKEERLDPNVEKYYLDPWGHAYRYRENDSKRERQYYMINRHSYDLWSIGKDGIDQSYGGENEGETNNDDLGNW